MSKTLPDEIYYELSKRAYDESYDNQKGKGNVVVTKDGSQWVPIVPDDARLNDDLSGFDAVVLKNRDTNQIVVSFRGTEGDVGQEKLRSVPDFVTDIKDIMLPDMAERSGVADFLRKADKLVESPVEKWVEKGYDKTVGKFFDSHNQFHLADDLVKQLMKQYPDAEISVTGHSLGGGLAQYAAAMNRVDAVTYSAPNVLYNLPKELQDLAKNGHYDASITNYVHPSDSVGAGGLYEYDRHIGSTYYIDNNFDDANRKYGGGVLGDLSRFWDSIKGDGYHYLQVYKFDKEGFIANKLFRADTGTEVIGGSPRHISAEEMRMVFNAALGLGSILQRTGRTVTNAFFGGERTIEVNPEQLKETGQRLRSHAQSFHHEMRSYVQSLTSLLQTSDSRRLQPIVEQIRTDLTAIDQWYTESTAQIAEFIYSRGADFEQADRAGHR